MQIEIETSIAQLLTGTRLPTHATCVQCDHPFEAGDHCIVSATRSEDAPTYTLERLYCPDCAPEELPSPTLGRSEQLFHARLNRTHDDHTHQEFQTLSDLQSIDASSPPDDISNTHDADPVALLPTAQTPDLTGAIYHLENDDEAGTPLCNCSLDAEYTPVALAAAESSSARCCQTCHTVRQGHQDTRPCPHCSAQIPLSAWPPHVRACTGKATDPDETNPEDDPAITTTISMPGTAGSPPQRGTQTGVNSPTQE